MDNDFNNANNMNPNWHNDTVTIPVEELQRAQEKIQNSYGFEVQPTAYDYNNGGVNYGAGNYGSNYNDRGYQGGNQQYQQQYQQPYDYSQVQNYAQGGEVAKSNNNKTLIIAFSVIIAAILIAGGIVAFVLLGGGSGDDTDTGSSSVIKVRDYTVADEHYGNDSVVEDIRDNQGYTGTINVLVVGADEFTDEMRNKGYHDADVVWQSEKPGTKIKGDEFSMEVRIAAGEKTEYGKMPYLYGISESEISNRMNEVGITDYEIAYENSSKYKEGLVCRQSCAPYYHPDEKVVITVSKG